MPWRQPHRYKIVILFAVFIAALAIAALTGPVAQSNDYHNFADQRMLRGLPNFWNVLSNLPFALFSLMGLYTVSMVPSTSGRICPRNAYSIFFSGALLVAFGSSYYHLNPGNDALFWDRLPMTIAFMALFSIIISTYVSKQAGTVMLYPLIIIGLLSVIYWHVTERNQMGDLRFYALVQFLPMVLIFLILVLFKDADGHRAYLWLMLGAYFLSKLAEHFDEQIYMFFNHTISGHTIKHILAALGVMFFYLRLRKQLSETGRVG